MAEASLIFNESELNTESLLYGLYSKFYEGMREANLIEAPDFSENPPLTGSGEIDIELIAEKLSEYSTILLKNSAYRMANSIVSAIGGGGDGGQSGGWFLLRNGDSMTGLFGALYGFEAGYDGKLIFDTTINAEEKKIATVSGHLIVKEDAGILGQLNLSDKGIYMSNTNVLYYADNYLNIVSEKIRMGGEIEVDGIFSLGEITISGSGLFYDTYEFYHGGNSNKKEVDWNMRNGRVYGNLQVDGTTILEGTLSAIQGFRLGTHDQSLFFSGEKEDGSVYLQLATDLDIKAGYGIQFDGQYIIRVRGGADNIVSFSAPGKVMNLGDSDNEEITQRIALQTSIYNYNSDYQIISQYGDGNFPNSLSAGCGNSGPVVIQTYYKDGDDCGVIFPKRIRFNSTSGPSFHASNIRTMVFEAPYIYVANQIQQTEYLQSSISYQQTNSLFRDQSRPWSASLNFHTDAEFFTFNKPVEAIYFSIISEKYKTQLIENALFFSDDIFLEGIDDGILHSGNAYFTDTLSSKRFAGGFAGYGWAIEEDKTVGNIAATFDELTVRKKMRIYELEVQKSTVTNGSLWVSDSCSGDLVEEMI